MMRRAPLLVAAVLCLAPGAAAQETDCDSICRIFPDRAPAECLCTAEITQGSSGGEFADPRVGELVGRARAEWRRQVAGVDNYTVAQTSSLGGPPIVLYYEKLIVEGEPVFRHVPETELRKREAEAEGRPTFQDMAGTIADLLGGASGPAPSDEPEAQDATGEPASEEAGEASATEPGLSTGAGAEEFPIGELLTNAYALLHDAGVVDAVAGAFEEMSQYSQEESRQDLADWWFSREMHDATLVRGAEIVVDGEPVTCNALYLGPDFARYRADAPRWHGTAPLVPFPIHVEFGFPDPEITWPRPWNHPDQWPEVDGHKLVAIAKYFPDETGPQRPIAMAAVFRDVQTGYWHVVRRVESDFTFENAKFVPKRAKMTLSGQMEGLIGDVQEVIHTVHKVLVNDGPPTQEQVVMLLQDVMGRVN